MNYLLIATTLILALLPQDEPNPYNTWRKVCEGPRNEKGYGINFFAQRVRQPPGAKYRRLRMKDDLFVREKHPEDVIYSVGDFHCVKRLYRSVSTMRRRGAERPEDTDWREIPPDSDCLNAFRAFACSDLSKDEK
jgi:hypothetical protein